MEKLDLTTPHFVNENITKLAELFPNCVTEKKNDKGEVVHAIDFDALRQEFSETIVEGQQERYSLNWPGKREALVTANTPISKTLRPCRDESVDFDNTKNIFIEGDNLDALKLLQETYLNKIKMIYIDPPYNTGNDFIYNDSFTADKDEYDEASGQRDEEGGRLVANPDSNGRFHSDWLSMIFPRLKLARNLLHESGVVFISIDDNEQSNLKKLCDEIFGEANFVAQISVQLNPRGRNLDKFVAKTHETVLVFVKDYMNEDSIFGIQKEGRMVKEYNKVDDIGQHRLTGLRNRNQAFNPKTRPKLYYPLYIEQLTGRVSLEKSDVFVDEIWPDTPDGIKTCWTWGKEKVVKENHLLIAEKTGDGWRVYRKDYLLDENGKMATTLVKSLWLDKEINNDYGRKIIKELLGSAVMSFPKSVDLIKKLIQIGAKEEDVVLDFFTGSGTTSHATMQLNAEDGGCRKCISVQLPEETDETSEAFNAGYKNIAEISKERLRRAGKKIKEDNADKEGIENLDIGFRVFKIDSSNMVDVHLSPDEAHPDMFEEQIGNIKKDRSSEDLLFQVLLDWGVDLSLPINREKIEGKEVFFVDGNALAACFDEDINEEFVNILAVKQPLRVVFRDDGFTSDAVKINVEQIFKLKSPATDIKVI
ncbi:Type III restriction-modification system methylation subunit [hydrothermal vent metagenome]|uniref:Type III restriction-modification system methylation subunit n=1 Tax=hydrothermal vent metagenome TaxID=652676 RepID=A0A3B0W112_9ZZZZ